MLRRLTAALALLALAAAPVLAQSDDVDPMIGTAGEGHTFPGAVAPFGMVQLSPDTDTGCELRECYGHAAGYRYEDATIQGFSHTHFSGAGHSDLGDFLIAPVSGDTVPLEPGDPKVVRSGYRSHYQHKNENAEPGYYSVMLEDWRVRAEMTAGTRVGVHRYGFRGSDAAHLVLDLRSSLYDYPGKVLWSSVRLRADGTITGSRQTRGWAPDRQLFFAIRFSRPIVSHAFVSTEKDVAYRGFQGPGRGSDRVPELSGRALVARFDFGKIDKPLEVKVAISSVDEDGAIANLDSENGSFDAIRKSTQAAWDKALGVLDVDGDAAMKKMVKTALYHSLIAPSVAGDVDGRWRGPDNQVHKADGFTFRSTFSLWDTFRAEHPLLTLVQPASVNGEIIRSLLASQEVSPQGLLPVWQFQGRETWTMIGYHAVPVIADAYLKGIGGFDATRALAGMIRSATYAPYGGLDDYMLRHYVAIDREPEAASKTVEYAYDDWALAQMARAMKQDDVATWFEARSGYWRETFDAKTGFIRARKADGTFREPFDPTAINYGSDYTEGNAWQYSWFVPQDQEALFQAMGGDQAAVAKLDQMFDFDNAKVDYSHAEDISGLIGQYIHGNEPSHHVAYLYDHAGEPWRTQERLTQIVASQYTAASNGLSGNDDLGQMSAWLVFTAMGFYPVTPASLQYVIGRPFLSRAVLKLPNGKTFTMVADMLKPDHPYIGAVMLNGRPLERSYITHEEIMAGGELRFAMSPTPNREWATQRHQRPFSASNRH
jgi:predicted alpha-1,2-mannosidase